MINAMLKAEALERQFDRLLDYVRKVKMQVDALEKTILKFEMLEEAILRFAAHVDQLERRLREIENDKS